MLHHVSFSVHDPERAANRIAALTGARAIEAPCPPFPGTSWFVVLGDAHGSLIELTPWGSVLNPEIPGISSDPSMRPHSASHVLAGTPLTTQEVLACAERMGLRAAPADARLFRFVKVWIEDSLLLEALPPEHLPDYVACFGAARASELDHRLRSLEQELASSLAQPRVRPARAHEIADIEEMNVAAYAEYKGVVPSHVFDAYVADLRNLTAQVSDGELLVCEAGGRLAGSVLFYRDASLEGLGLPSNWAGFRKLAVHPDKRGAGVGRALVDACLQGARASGAKALGIHTASFMTTACRLYEEVGFRRTPEYDIRASDMLGTGSAAGDVAVIAYRLAC